MKLLFFIIAILLFTGQVDYYDLDVNGNSITIEAEENNFLAEEFITNNFDEEEDFAFNFNFIKIFSYSSILEQLHFEDDIDPPEQLS